MTKDIKVKILRDKLNLEYKKMLKILLACKEANIFPPPEVNEYFGGGGVNSDEEYPLEIEFKKFKPFADNFYYGIEINVNDLPDGSKTIKIYLE